MKKILIFATVALLTTSASFASKGKKCGKDCNKKKAEKTEVVSNKKVKEVKG